MLANFRRLLITGAVLFAATVVLSVSLTTGDFLYVPNEADPIAESVAIPSRPDRSDDAGGIYSLVVTVREARWAEQLIPFLRPDGSTLVAGERVRARGETFDERRAQALSEMARAEEIASAVALRAAGIDVAAKPRGALVVGVAEESPSAGLLEPGDVIVAVGATPTRTPDALRKAVNTVSPGTAITLRLLRDGKAQTQTVTTMASPDDPDRTIIGIAVEQDAKIVLPFKVNIDLGDVGGPSAGLAFALQILQELGRDVDRGYTLAVTGAIELDGAVVSVGGIKQKTIGARRSGADVLLVPAGDNAIEARRYAGNLRVIAVESFQQALRSLQTLPVK